jgi:hypothetical protein
VVEAKDFLLLRNVQTDSEAHPTAYPMDTRVFVRVKRPEPKVVLRLSSAEVTSPWSYTSTTSMCLHGVDSDIYIF